MVKSYRTTPINMAHEAGPMDVGTVAAAGSYYAVVEGAVESGPTRCGWVWLVAG